MRRTASRRHRTLFLLISFLSFPLFSLGSSAQESSLPALSISAYLEEVVSVGEICYQLDTRVWYATTVTYDIVWDMPAYPFNDPTSPEGYWSGFVWLAPADGSWMILPQQEHEGRYQISYTLGCFENGNVDSIRQSFLITTKTDA